MDFDKLFFGGLVVLFVGLMLSLPFFSFLECSQRASQMKLNHNWGFIKGCMIETKQGWVPLDNFREINK